KGADEVEKADSGEEVDKHGQTSKADRAREYALRGVKVAPKDYRMYELLYQLELAKQRPDEALIWLKKGVDANGPPDLWWRLGNLQIVMGKLSDVDETIKTLRYKTWQPSELQTPVSPSLYADLLEAQREQVQGNWRKATELLASLGIEL